MSNQKAPHEETGSVISLDHEHIALKDRRGTWKICGKTATEIRIAQLTRAFVMAANGMNRKDLRAFYAQLRADPQTAGLV